MRPRAPAFRQQNALFSSPALFPGSPDTLRNPFPLRSPASAFFQVPACPSSSLFSKRPPALPSVPHWQKMLPSPPQTDTTYPSSPAARMRTAVSPSTAAFLYSARISVISLPSASSGRASTAISTHWALLTWWLVSIWCFMITSRPASSMCSGRRIFLGA